MKEKIMIFIIGLLLGSVISTGSIFIYTIANNTNSNNNNQMQMNGGQPPEMGNQQQPPEMPNNTQNSNQTNSN